MADTYEKDLAQKSAVTISDYVRLVGTDNVSYKQPIYSMCAPYSNPSGTDLVSVVKALNQGTYFYRMDNVSGFPVSGGVVYRIVKTHGAGDARASILAIPMDTNANIYTTFITSASATSITWTAQPTRAEVDALTAKRVYSTTFKSGNPLSIYMGDVTDGVALLYGLIQGLTSAGVFLIVVVNGSIQSFVNVTTGATVGSPLSASFSNGTLTVSTTNTTNSRTTLTAL